MYEQMKYMSEVKIIYMTEYYTVGTLFLGRKKYRNRRWR
jgi:hypothetical protein